MLASPIQPTLKACGNTAYLRHIISFKALLHSSCSTHILPSPESPYLSPYPT